MKAPNRMMPAGINKPASAIIKAPAPKPVNNGKPQPPAAKLALPVIELSPVVTTPTPAQTVTVVKPVVNPVNDNTRTVTFTKVKETKNTVVFSEDAVKGQPPIIGQLYLQKWFVGDETTVTLNVTVGK